MARERELEQSGTGGVEGEVTCRAIAEGRRVLLLRKGGITEATGAFDLYV